MRKCPESSTEKFRQMPKPVADTISSGPRLVRFDSYTVDLARKALFLHGKRVHLTSKPFDTLVALLSRPGDTVSKELLLETVWKDTAVTEDVLVQAIGEIRRALGEKKGEDRFIQTVPRQGYRFVMPVTGVEDSNADAEVVAPAASDRRWRRWPAVTVSLAALACAAIPGFLMFRRVSTSASGSIPNSRIARLAGLSTHAAIHAAGVVARIDGDDNRNADIALEWRPSGERFRSGHPLIRIDERHFAGSLFWLTADTSYEVRITAHDPDDAGERASHQMTFRTEADVWPEPTLGVLHVSPTGRDTYTGASADRALRTIQRAADLATAGDVVLIHPGLYRETVRVRRSGTWIQPLVFRGTGPGVILDGADETIATGVPWRAIEPAIYAREMSFVSTHVTTERGRLFNYRTLDDLRALRAGAPGGFYADRQRLYIRFSDGSSPAAHKIHVSRLDHGFIVDKQEWVSIEDVELRHFGGAEGGVGILLRHCRSCRVRRNHITDVGRAGIWIEGGERVRIEENEIADTSIAGWPWHAINGSTADNHGIFVDGASPRGLIVRRNRIHGTYDAIAPCGTAAPSSGVTSEVDVYENEMTELADDGVEAEPYCANLRIWGNRIVGSLMAISTAPAGPGPIWIVRNIAHRFGASRGREVWLASAFKINTLDKRETGPILLYHNTFVADVPAVDGIALLDPGKVALVRARNNLIAGTRHALMKQNSFDWDGDGNDLHTSSNLPLVQWLGVTYPNIRAFRTATGQERMGFSAEPMLADPARGDFSPRPGSPLIDRGLVIPGINDGFVGRAPDVGAIELHPSVLTVRAPYRF